MLTPEIKELITHFGVGAVATVAKDGTPRVSPKGTFLVWSDTELVFGNIRSPQTVANLQANPSVEVCFTDIFQRLGCRVSGTARHFENGTPEFEAYHAAFSKRWPTLAHVFKGYVSISVDRAQPLKSPVYDVGSNPADLDRTWLETYKELVARRQRRHS